MRKARCIAALALFLTGSLVLPANSADIGAILGKWVAKADTPNGPVEVEFDLRKEGDNLVGTAALFQGKLPLSAVKWEDPQLQIQFDMGGMVFKMQGTLRDNKFTGTWEQVSGDMKGAWAAERSGAPVQAAAGAATGLAGSWSLVANTPQGDLEITMDAKQDGEKVTGSLSSAMGSVDMQSGSIQGDKLQFDIDMGGNTFRIEATVTGDRLTGKWGPAAGGEGGKVSGNRKGAAAPTAGAATAAAPAPSVDGAWTCVALTPVGDMPFELKVTSDGEKVTGTAGTAEGSIQIGNGKFAAGKLSFEVEYMGGTYRIDAVVEGAELKGKWSEVGGTENGAFNGKRKS